LITVNISNQLESITGCKKILLEEIETELRVDEFKELLIKKCPKLSNLVNYIYFEKGGRVYKNNEDFFIKRGDTVNIFLNIFGG